MKQQAKAKPLEMVPLTDLSAVNTRVVREGAVQRIASIANVGALIDGSEVTQFEERWADYVGARYCVAVANGTDALELAVRGAWGAEQTAGLSIPAFSFVATAEAVVRAGEEIRLQDVDPVSLLAERPVDIGVGLYGQRPPVCRVLDAAQSHGWRVAWATAAWSFYPTKNLGAWGDAGAVTTQDEGLAEEIRALARHGYNGATGCGFNSRMDSVQAAVLIEKLPRLDEWNTERMAAADEYRRRGVELIGGTDSVYHLAVIRVDRRDRVLREMLKRRVSCGVHYPLALSEMPWLDQFVVEGGGSACHVAQRAAAEVLSLPLWPGMSLGTIERVVEALGESVAAAAKEGDG